VTALSQEPHLPRSHRSPTRAFYRGMHFSAKRGLAIACRPSVRLSVRLSVTLVDCDHIGWKSWKLLHRLLAQHLRFLQPKGDPPTPSGTWRNFGETRGEVGKMAFWGTKAAISLKRVKMEEKLLWIAYRNSPTVFRTVPSRPPSRLGFAT